jgi:hypothetical protein
VGSVASGQLRVLHDDGTEVEVGPGDAYVIEPGHDGWVIGSEPFVAVLSLWLLFEAGYPPLASLFAHADTKEQVKSQGLTLFSLHHFLPNTIATDWLPLPDGLYGPLEIRRQLLWPGCG